MKINFSNIFHHKREKLLEEEELRSLDFNNITYVLLNRRAGESLLYYKDGTSKFVNNSIGEKILSIINKKNKK